MHLFRVALVLSSLFLNLCTYALWTRIIAGNKARGKGTTAAEHWGVSTTFHCDAPVFSHFDRLHFLVCFGLFFFQCYTCYICSTGTGGCHCWRLTTAGNSGNSSVSICHTSAVTSGVHQSDGFDTDDPTPLFKKNWPSTTLWHFLDFYSHKYKWDFYWYKGVYNGI